MKEVDMFKENTGLSLHEQYMKHHPQVLSEFEEEMPKYWGKKWKANTTIGKLRTVLLHRPGKEFLSVGKPTPWPPHSADLGAWRMSWKPKNLSRLTEDYERLWHMFTRIIPELKRLRQELHELGYVYVEEWRQKEE